MKRVIIDTDPGIDDAAAILFALASPELTVEALTTVFGNGPLEMSTTNARRILQAAGRTEIPVYQGAGRPLLREPNAGWALHVHGPDGLGDAGSLDLPEKTTQPASQHAALKIIELVMASPGELTILALGRLTNVALAMRIEPRLARSVAGIIVMGGAVNVPGNVSPVASANLYEDPEAASIVYESGAPLVQVGLDVCNQVTIARSQLDRIRQSGSPGAQLLTSATPFLQQSYIDRGLQTQADGVRYNDLPTAAYAVAPEWFGCTDYYVQIETHSPITRGQTVASLQAPEGKALNASVCLEVDAAALAETFTQRLSEYRPA